MTNVEIAETRMRDLVQILVSRCCVFFTLTTPDIVDHAEIRRRWRLLRHWLLRKLPKGTKYVMNYELHPKGHGWHIHAIFNSFIPLKSYGPIIRSFGFGNLNVHRVNDSFVYRYLLKHAFKVYKHKYIKDVRIKRFRFINCSRGLPRIADYIYLSDFLLRVRALFRSVFPKSEHPLSWWREQYPDLPWVAKSNYHVKRLVYLRCEILVALGFDRYRDLSSIDFDRYLTDLDSR